MSTAFVPEYYFRPYNVPDIFGEGDTCEVDLGCGDGGFLLAMAAHYPERRFLGVERLLGRIRKVCSESARRGLTNVRGLRVESRYFLEWLIAPGSISRLHYLFPDPWPKEKHHKNRLVQDSFIPVLHKALATDGEVLFKTDHEDYFIWVCEKMDASPLFRRADWVDDFYPKTDFQKQWEAMGKPIYAARFIRNNVI
ncbi:MAG: tRNA (guanosine(46)-N7)-methyltransferase TrmB [Akkermansia sp.]|nr:tRNA (guanosine(46)-N7)-methyltransferase TrmB [Akkermansia sp.]